MGGASCPDSTSPVGIRRPRLWEGHLAPIRQAPSGSGDPDCGRGILPRLDKPRRDPETQIVGRASCPDSTSPVGIRRPRLWEGHLAPIRQAPSGSGDPDCGRGILSRFDEPRRDRETQIVGGASCPDLTSPVGIGRSLLPNCRDAGTDPGNLTHFLSIQPADMQVDFVARFNLAHPSIDHVEDSVGNIKHLRVVRGGDDCDAVVLI